MTLFHSSNLKKIITVLTQLPAQSLAQMPLKSLLTLSPTILSAPTLPDDLSTLEDINSFTTKTALESLKKNFSPILIREFGPDGNFSTQDFSKVLNFTAKSLDTISSEVDKRNSAAHSDAFLFALKTLLVSQSELPTFIENESINPLRAHYTSILSNILQTAVDNVNPYDPSERLERGDDKAVKNSYEDVFTAHPCDGHTTEYTQNLGTFTEAVSTSTSQEHLSKTASTLIDSCPIKKKPTVSDEMKMGLEFGKAMFHAVPKLELEQGLEPGGLRIKHGTWIGFESDRNEVTPELQLLAAAKNVHCATTQFIPELQELSSTLATTNSKTASTFAQLSYRTRELQENSDTAIKLSHAVAAVEIFRGAILDPDGFASQEGIKQNLAQFFPGKDLGEQLLNAKKTILDMESSIIGIPNFISLLKDTPDPDYASPIQFAHKLSTKSQKDTFNTDIAQASLRAAYRNCLADSLPLEKACLELTTSLLSTTTDEDARCQLFTVSSQLKSFGIHFSNGEGRLDSTQLHQTAEVLFKQNEKAELGPKIKSQNPQHEQDKRAQQLINAIEHFYGKESPQAHGEELVDQLGSGESDVILDNPVKSRAQELLARKTANFFRSAADLEAVDGSYKKMMIIANDEGAIDYLETFYIAISMGLIQFDKDGNVTQSDIVIMPLKESVSDHDDAAGEFEKLWSIPVVRKYLMSSGMAPYMKAYSDTGRGDGQPAALSRLVTTPTEVQSKFDDAFSRKFEEDDRVKKEGRYGLFSSNDAYNQYWRDILSNPESTGLEPTPKDEKPSRPQHHGVGSHPLREGGRWMDRFVTRLRPSCERGGWQTTQPGELNDAYQNQSAALKHLHYRSSINQDNDEAQLVAQALDDLQVKDTPFSEFFKSFVENGHKAFLDKVVSSDSALNDFLNNSDSGWLALATFKYGSRGGAAKNPLERVYKKTELGSDGKPLDPTNPGKPKSFTSTNRAIASAATWQRLGGDLHVIESLFAIMNDSNQPETETLRTLYKTNIIFNVFIRKMAEHLLRTDFDRIALDMNSSPHHTGETHDKWDTLREEYQSKFYKVKSWLLDISGQDKSTGELLTDLPQLRQSVSVDRRTNYVAGLITHKCLKEYNPRDEVKKDRSKHLTVTVSPGSDWYQQMEDQLDAASSEYKDALRAKLTILATNSGIQRYG